MQASAKDISALIDLQQTDAELNQLNKQLLELPQRQVILNTRTKRSEIETKLNKVSELKKNVTKKLTRIEDEDASLEKKEKGVQAAIEAAGGDFRGVEARTKELNGIFKRRNTLSEEKSAAEGELLKVEELESQVKSAIATLDKTEAQATESFQNEGGALKLKIAEKQAKHDDILSHLSAEVIKAYKIASKHTSSVVVGKLDGDRCGICRSLIEGGRLIDLKNQAPLGVCPNCERLLIIE